MTKLEPGIPGQFSTKFSEWYRGTYVGTDPKFPDDLLVRDKGGNYHLVKPSHFLPDVSNPKVIVLVKMSLLDAQYFSDPKNLIDQNSLQRSNLANDTLDALIKVGIK